ncbi:hypothetical protein HX890_12550 [Pseudomonas gingeri]|uniref:hypothetical protein n=1 Tax=Pseudomonas gingeri TaxID=117681 RepID=UPI0015A41E15|nr:hypothetical protein [Pseudomonas gingeri]NWD74935.1 hypothetical protein [Pseudomonas gingeri]
MAGRVPREPLLSPGEVQRRYERMTQQERLEFDNTLGDIVVGSRETCRSRVRHIPDEYGGEEIGLVTVTYSFADLLRSYRLLAEAFDIGAS